MKHKHLLVILLILALVWILPACDNNAGGEETVAETKASTSDSTEAPIETTAEPETTEAPTEEPTEAPTEEVTEAETFESMFAEGKVYREDFEEDDPENPFNNLIPVGTSYDGKTTCYDGRYDFGFAICRTSDGAYFYSVQEAVWHLEEMGGGSIMMSDSTNVCLMLEFPRDFCDYRLYFEFHNVDFVFNYGNIYDDCTPNADGVHGYGYYADLYALDSVSPALGNTNVWMIGGNDGFDEPGRYLIIDEYNEDRDYLYMYQYVQDGNLSDWPGLPFGEQ